MSLLRNYLMIGIGVSLTVLAGCSAGAGSAGSAFDLNNSIQTFSNTRLS